MSIICLPFDTQSISEAQWHSYIQIPAGQGIIAGHLNELKATGFSGGMFVKVDSGEARILGAWLQSSSQDTYAVPANASGITRFDRLVVRIDFSANTGIIAIKIGSGGLPPALQRDATVWEMSLGQITVINGASNIASGDVADERGDPSLCGWAYSPFPFRVVQSASVRPTNAAPGEVIFQLDTHLCYVNTGTYATPVWTLQGPFVPTVPALSLGTSNIVGSGQGFIQPNATIALFDVTVPSTQAIGDAAAVGTQPFAARRDHKHAMPSFATSGITLSNAQGPGVAVTPLRSDAVIAAFDGTAPSNSALADAAAVGAINFAARRDHVHGRESNPHLIVYKTSPETRNNTSALADDADLHVTVPASSVWQFECVLLAVASSSTPNLKLLLTSVAATGSIIYGIQYIDYPAAVPTPTDLYAQDFINPIVINLYVASLITIIRISGILNNTSSTTFKLRWAQNIATVAVTELINGSYLLMHRIS